MILVDTSVWVEFLRGVPGPATTFVREHIGVDVATCEPVMMELIAGARPGAASLRLESMLLSQSWCRVEPALDYRGAAELFHAARAIGRPPRSLQDCLIAAIALRHQVAVAHRDVDFSHLADATGLAVVDLRG